MNEQLKAFLRQAAAEPFALGQWDCAMTVANWVWRLTGTDPATTLRGRYRTDKHWTAIVLRAGGLTPLMDGLARNAGLVSVEEPEPGDIGALWLPIIGLAAGIRTADRWVVKARSGIASGKAPAAGIWGLR